MKTANSKRLVGNLQSLRDCRKKSQGHPRYLELELITGRLLVFEGIAKMRLIGQKLELWIKGEGESYTYGISFIKGVLWVS